MTVIYPSPIFGPIHSRRLGVSLGINLMPGDTTRYAFEDKYTVGAPSAAVANLELNVMYSGYENRFSVSVPGYGDD